MSLKLTDETKEEGPRRVQNLSSLLGSLSRHKVASWGGSAVVNSSPYVKRSRTKVRSNAVSGVRNLVDSTFLIQ